MIALVLTRADNHEMIARALNECPDVDDLDAVVRHLHALRLSVSSIGSSEFQAIWDEARTVRTNRKVPNV